MAKVWNITDHPATDLPARVMMVLGRSIRPGKCINVPDERLVRAHKVHRAVAAGKLFIGPNPPVDYLKAKRPTKLTIPDGAGRAHGTKTKVEKKTLVLEDKVEVKDEVTAEAKPAEPVEPIAEPEDKPDEEAEVEKSSSKRKKRGMF